MTKDKLPVFQFTLDEDDASSGIRCVALVDVPAIDSKAFFFSKTAKSKFVKVDDKEYEGKVAGLLLRHSYPILRQAETGEYYYGEFSQTVVKQLQERFHKQLQSNNVNTDHSDSDTVDAFMVSDFLISSEELLAHVKAQGIEEAQLGDWYGVYQINVETDKGKEAFERVVKGELTGFSIEAYLDVEMRKLLKNNNDFNKLFPMNKKEKNLFKRFLTFMEQQVEQFEEVKADSELVPEQNFTINWTEVGEDVTKTYVPEGSEESVTEPAGEGTFITESGLSIVVDADSKLVEVVEAAPEEAPAEEEASKEEKPTEMAAEEKPKEEEKPNSDLKAMLDALLGQYGDGDFSIMVSKSGDEYKWGSVSMWKDLRFAKDVEAEVAVLNEKIEKLEKENGEQPAVTPDLGLGTPTGKPDVDYSKLSAYERIALDNGWQNIPKVQTAK